jgi:hypothetical protein
MIKHKKDEGQASNPTKEHLPQKAGSRIRSASVSVLLIESLWSQNSCHSAFSD